MKVYDLFVPFGSNCRPAYYIKELGFRKGAYPLDWNTFKHTIVRELFTNRFSDFFASCHEVFDNPGKEDGYRVLVDEKYNIECFHYIREDYSLMDELNAFISVMKKRFERLDAHIKESGSILLLSNSWDMEEELVDSLKFMGEFYPEKTFTLLNVRDISSGDEYHYEKKISDNLSFIEYGIYDSDDNNSWIGNSDKWFNILSDYYMSCNY